MLTRPPLGPRLTLFSASTIEFIDQHLTFGRLRHIGDQLLRCSTAIGANYQEAQAGESKADFIHKLQIALKECREACYWLETLSLGKLSSNRQLKVLLQESIQLRAILSKAVATAKSRL